MRKAAAEWALATSLHGPADFLAARSRFAKAAWVGLMVGFSIITFWSKSGLSSRLPPPPWTPSGR